MLDLRETTQAKYRCIVNGEQLEQTIAAAHEPFGTLFTVAALTGARISELCGLTWADVRVDNLGDAEIEFGWQVDRHGSRRPMETDGSARTVPIPRELALVLAGHRRGARYTAAEASCSRPAPAGRCNSATSRGLWAARSDVPSTQMEARRSRSSTKSTAKGNLSRSRAECSRRCTRSGTRSPRALLAGESVDEVAFLLGHGDGTVTRRCTSGRSQTCAADHAPVADDGGARRRPPSRARRPGPRGLTQAGPVSKG